MTTLTVPTVVSESIKSKYQKAFDSIGDRIEDFYIDNFKQVSTGISGNKHLLIEAMDNRSGISYELHFWKSGEVRIIQLDEVDE